MASPRGRSAEFLAQALGAGLVLPACTVAGYLAGKWLAGLAGWRPDVPAYAGAALGVAAGFWNLFALLARLDRPRGDGS